MAALTYIKHHIQSRLTSTCFLHVTIFRIGLLCVWFISMISFNPNQGSEHGSVYYTPLCFRVSAILLTSEDAVNDFLAPPFYARLTRWIIEVSRWRQASVGSEGDYGCFSSDKLLTVILSA